MVDKEFKVLDHGYIRVIDSMGLDETIIEAARMSTGKGFQGWDPGERCRTCGWRADVVQGLDEAAARCDKNGAHHIMEKVPGDMSLLDYLWRMGHATPFEMCELHIEVNAPILVWRQWFRHRTMSFNEASGRYSKMSDEHYLPDAIRVQYQDKKNKQGGSHTMPSEFISFWLDAMMKEQDEVYSSYEDAIEHGMANETARLNCPVSRYSKARVKTDLRNWLGFLKLRMHPHAQWEIRQYADVIGNKIISQLWPKTWEVFKEHTLEGVSFSKKEMELIRHLLADPQMIKTSTFDHGLGMKRLEEFIKKLRGS